MDNNNNSNTRNADNSMIGSEWADVSGEPNWDENIPVDNTNSINHQNTAHDPNISTTLDISDVTDYASPEDLIENAHSTSNNIVSIHNPTNLANKSNTSSSVPYNNESSTPAYNDTSLTNNQNNQSASQVVDQAVNQNLNQSVNQNPITVAQGQENEIEVAPYTPEAEAQNQEEIPVILPTTNDDASLQAQLRNATTNSGKANLRIVAVVIVVVLGVIFYLGVENSDPNKAGSDNRTVGVKPLPVKDIKSELRGNITPDMGTCPEPITNGKEQAPTPVETPPPVIVNTPPPAPVIVEPTPQQVAVEKVVEKPRQFAFRMRTGDEMVKDYEEKAKVKEVPVTNVATPKVKIPRGTMLPLMMLQPFRNDIPTVVKCQIMSDVKTSKGELLIPSGTTAFVPFAQFRNDKRVFNRVDSPMTLSLADGTEIQLTGTAVDKSGGIGVAGKVVKKGDAGIGKRIGRTMARVLTFGAASAVGGVGGGAIAEAGNATVDGSYYYTAPTTSYVEVPPGTVFFFNVSGN